MVALPLATACLADAPPHPYPLLLKEERAKSLPYPAMSSSSGRRKRRKSG